MLQFFRNNVEKIGWAIVIAFGVTMFAGSFFLGDMYRSESPTSKTDVQALKNAIAVVGDQPVNARLYASVVNRIAASSGVSPDDFSPEMVEMIRYQALMQTVQEMVLLQGAKESGMVLNKLEKQGALDSILIQFDLKNKREMKKFLKEKNVPVKPFIASVEDDFLVRKFVQSLQDKVVVSDDDVDNLFKDVKVEHILITVSPEDDVAEREVFANQIYDALGEKKFTFIEGVQRFSQDEMTKRSNGLLGWVSVGQTVPSFEEVAFSLKVGEVSRPVQSDYGFHIIRLVDKRTRPKAKDFDITAAKEQLLQQRREGAVNSYVQSVLHYEPLVIQDPELKAYDEKLKGNVNGALAAYQMMVSRDPYSPLPHYLSGKVYMMIQNFQKALEEVKKAEVKVELSPQLAFSELFLLKASIYAATGEKKLIVPALQKAEAVAGERMFILKELSKQYAALGQTKLANQVNVKIELIETERAAIEENISTQNSDLE